jgi:choice-of-anchor C domain-containing protein
MLKTKALAALAICAALSPMAQASAELIVNGGFESANGFTGSFQPLSSGLVGWSIDSGSVDLINAYWTPASGAYSLDLNGNGPGTISQSFATQVNQTYLVSFAMAGNPDGGSNKSIFATVTAPNTYTFDITGVDKANMGWVTHTFTFVATSTSSTLSFVGNVDNSAYGAALDDVSVTAVPEPETYAMLLGGLGLMGYMARRRQRGATK